MRYPAGKRKRQRTYLEALETTGGIEIIFGRYQKEIVRCLGCGDKWRSDKEKMTDVRIAVEMMSDAFQNRFDRALVVSADGDLEPPIKAIRELFPSKRISVYFPPKRRALSITRVANNWLVLWRKTLKSCQLPDPVVKTDGFELRRPTPWN